jgi:agmatine deiminase
LNLDIITPKQLNYRFPAEWEKHRATWLSWPHKEESWPGKIESIYPIYAQFIKALTSGEFVCININNEQMKAKAIQHLEKQNVDLTKVNFYLHPTNDAWCRDHGPSFLINPSAENKKVIIDWNYNAWGNKYPPYNLDDVIPTLIGKEFNIPVFNPGIVMEGGSVEFNGKGTLLTSKACLLNQNRNPHLNQSQIEKYLRDYYCVDNILWVNDGIVGDDTDGHIDDITRFVNQDTVVTVVEHNKDDENYLILKENVELLEKMKLENGKQLNII